MRKRKIIHLSTSFHPKNILKPFLWLKKQKVKRFCFLPASYLKLFLLLSLLFYPSRLLYNHPLAVGKVVLVSSPIANKQYSLSPLCVVVSIPTTLVECVEINRDSYRLVSSFPSKEFPQLPTKDNAREDNSSGVIVKYIFECIGDN